MTQTHVRRKSGGSGGYLHFSDNGYGTPSLESLSSTEQICAACLGRAGVARCWLDIPSPVLPIAEKAEVRFAAFMSELTMSAKTSVAFLFQNDLRAGVRKETRFPCSYVYNTEGLDLLLNTTSATGCLASGGLHLGRSYRKESSHIASRHQSAEQARGRPCPRTARHDELPTHKTVHPSHSFPNPNTPPFSLPSFPLSVRRQREGQGVMTKKGLFLQQVPGGVLDIHLSC